MKIAELLLWAVAGWCAIGLIGTILSLAQGRRAEAMRHAAWLAATAGIYLLVLLGVSTFQRQRIVAVGQDQCFAAMCFRVTGADERPGLVTGAPDRVFRVRIAVSNHGRSLDRLPAIRAYLVDSRGRQWQPVPGLSGNPLNSSVSPGLEIVSQPLFRVPANATSLGLVLVGAAGETGRFIIGNSDSLAHQPTIVPLPQ